MGNYYNYEMELENLWNSIPTSVWLIFMFLLVVIVAGVIVAYVFSSLGIKSAADKNKIPNSWLAFIPCARSYLVSKMGYEIYADDNKKNPTIPWITLGVSIATVVLSGDLYRLASVALIILDAIAFYNIFKATTSKSTLYTVLSVIFGEFAGGVILFTMRNNLKVPTKGSTRKHNVEEADITNEEKDEEPKAKKTSKTKALNFCPECGAKLSDDSKFCPNCGHELK